MRLTRQWGIQTKVWDRGADRWTEVSQWYPSPDTPAKHIESAKEWHPTIEHRLVTRVISDVVPVVK